MPILVVQGCFFLGISALPASALIVRAISGMSANEQIYSSDFKFKYLIINMLLIGW